MSIYADIIIDISHENLDRTFQYRIPDNLSGVIGVGDRVTVPFGKGDRQITGFVLELSDAPKISRDKIKDVLGIVKDSSLVEQKLINLAYWMKTRYGSTMNHVLKTVLPVKKDVKNNVIRKIVLNVPVDEAERIIDEYKTKRRTARIKLITELIAENEIEYTLVTKKLNISAATIRILEEDSVIRIENERVYRNTVKDLQKCEKNNLLPEQRTIADDFIRDYDNGIRTGYLICGVTGSGKTEVYMEMIEHVVNKGQSCIVLIPEIALTYQTVMRFYKRFGDRVSTLHSRLSEGERYDQFERARKHELDIMIGPRSALFTPFDNLGLIVIDEEHENSYKSDKVPKYHAREVAQKLAELHGASLVLGSATPDVTSYCSAASGEMKLYTLDKRAKGAKLPTAHIVDLREELKSGNKSIFSNTLREKIGERLLNNEQSMIFLNRRGYSGFVSCRSCGEAVKCPHCDVSLSLHKNGKLVCHYCGHEQGMVNLCPKCGSKYIGGMRIGTEGVEEQIKKLFPQARVLRMDKDTTRGKDDYENILAAFANREADILVGTQMIVKGHDFPYVTLVGILAADMSLNGGDYKAAERTYQLVVQASGRAGRSERPGEVVIQTYQPEHYAITCAVRQNYTDFYEEEIGLRSIMGYPPMGHMLAILVESETEGLGQKCADSLAEIAGNAIMKNGVVIGPAPATVKKISDIYRFMIYVKSRDENLLINVKDRIEEKDYQRLNKGLRISFDLDPVNGY